MLTLEDGALLPSGPFEGDHPTLQTGLRAWVERQTHHPLGYVEQLYTFADRDRVGGRCRPAHRVDLLSRADARAGGGRRARAGLAELVSLLPVGGLARRPARLLARAILPRLGAGSTRRREPAAKRERRQRVEIAFRPTARWNEELVLQRYELLYEAGLVPEAGAAAQAGRRSGAGRADAHDHRRILATGIARLRAKIKYRPVVFELMPPAFTLLQLQRAVEALAGRRLHKQNFRRLIEQQGLVEETGGMSAGTGGRRPSSSASAARSCSSAPSPAPSCRSPAPPDDTRRFRSRTGPLTRPYAQD